MKEQLEKHINEFGATLTENERNQYIPKLRDYFVGYILENHKDIKNAKELFEREFTMRDVIGSTRYYVTNNVYVTSKSAIPDFLIALNRFHQEHLQDIYKNPTLDSLRPFARFSSEIETEIENKDGIILSERQTAPPIDEEQFDVIVECLKSQSSDSEKSKKVSIIVKLLLIYGFKFKKIIDMKTSDYDMDKGTLKTAYQENKSLRYITLKLPLNLNDEFKQYINSREKDTELMFLTTTDSKIKNSFLKDFFDECKKMFDFKKYGVIKYPNKFTPTGLAKYGIIKMISKEMNQTVIMQLTGMDMSIIKDCQNIYNLNTQAFHKDIYVNDKILNIGTYNRFQEIPS